MLFFRQVLSIVALASGATLTVAWVVLLGFEVYKLAAL
jgi:hypothetical protein